MPIRFLLLFATLSAFGVVAKNGPSSAAATPQPSARLDLSSAGYNELSAMARRSDKVNFTIDFIDSDRLLLTYNPKKLVTRLPECPPTHDDHLIHAAILDAHTGRVLRSMDWYLHDGRRYLWPLGAGKFLLRRLKSLYEIDTDLKEKLLFNSPVELLWVSVTPDGKQIITETTQNESQGKSKSKNTVWIEFRDAQSLAVQRAIKSEKEVHTEATSSGFASVIPGLSGRVWLIRFGQSEQQRDNIARVKTRSRAPDVLYLSGNTLLFGRDSASHPGYNVSAFTVTGNRLWRQHWDEHRYSPLVERSEDGSRFAISTLRLVDQAIAPVPDDPTDSSLEGLAQTIQVSNTASGDPVISVDANPVVLSGQNFALSPDGTKLAVLHGLGIDVYDLPEMSNDERAKYTAVKADVPGLYAPPSKPDENSDEAAFTVPDENGLPPKQPQTAASVSTTASQPVSTDAPKPSLSVSRAPAALLTFRSRRQVVTLDAVVTDAKGHPIPRISKDGFVVKEDGKPQTISYFDEVNASSSDPAAQPAPDPRPESKAANIFSNYNPQQAPQAVTLILYDLLNTPAYSQQSAKQDLLNFIEHKPKGERFALCTLSDGLRMIQGFTPDENILARAIKNNKGSLRYTSMQGQDASDQMLVKWLQQGAAKNVAVFSTNAGVSASATADQAGRIEEEIAQRRSRDLEFRMAVTMDAFTQIARYLSALPGRKSLIWLSGSFPLGIFPGMDFRDFYSDSATTTEQMKQAVNSLAESHVAVYPVDVRGLNDYTVATSPFRGGLDSTRPAESPNSNNQPSVQQRFDQLSNLNAAGGIGPNLPGGSNSLSMDDAMGHGVMDQIAADTGGKAFYNANGIEQVMNIAMEQEANYYALSYTPANKTYDGKFRRIKVTLANGDKKNHVIHRSGYFAVDPDAPSAQSKDAATGFGLASMQHDAPQSRQLLFEARIVPIGKPFLAMDPRGIHSSATKRKKHESDRVSMEPIEMQRYEVDYAITPSQVYFDSTPDGLEHGAMNFMLASFDGDGTVRTSIASRVKRDLKPDEFQDVMTGGFRLHQQVDVPVAAAFLRLGVQDAITGRLGTLEAHLPIKAPLGMAPSRTQKLPEIEPD